MKRNWGVKCPQIKPLWNLRRRHHYVRHVLKKRLKCWDNRSVSVRTQKSFQIWNAFLEKVWVAGFWMRSRECEADARKERVSVRLWKDSRCPDELWRKRPYFHFCCWSWSSRTGQLSQRSTKRTRHPMTPSVLTHLEATLAWPFEILWGSSWLGGTEVQSCHIWLCPVNLSSLTYWNPFLVKWMFFGDLIDSL